VSQPFDTLVAQKDAKSAFSTLFLGLGAIAQLVGAIGVANFVIISVPERRSEIGCAARSAPPGILRSGPALASRAACSCSCQGSNQGARR
jgi:hypothetical protein